MADSSTHVLTALPRGRIPEQVRGTEFSVLMTLALLLGACLTQMGQEEELDRDGRIVDDKLELLESHRCIDGPYWPLKVGWGGNEMPESLKRWGIKSISSSTKGVGSQKGEPP